MTIFRGTFIDTPENPFNGASLRVATDAGLLVRALPVLARVLRGDGPPPLFPVVTREWALSRLARAAGE